MDASTRNILMAMRWLFLLLLTTATTYANVYSRTNEILALDPSANPMGVQRGSQFRLSAITRSGGAAFDLNSYTIRFNLTDPVDNYLVATGITAIVDATNGEFTVRLNASSTAILDLGRQYRGVSGAYTGSTLIATLSDDYINIVETYCSTCSVSGGGGGSTSVTVTNLIVSTNLISVTVTNTGGGGGGTLSGFNSATTGGVFLVVSNGWDASITNEGNVFTIYTGLPRGSTGVNQVATWNGTNWIATALGAPTPTPSVGTNVQRWSTAVFPQTNTFIAPSTQIMFTVWGATGGGGSGGGGHSRALWVGAAGTIFDIVVGTRGLSAAATNNGPFSGAGINAGNTNHQNGGGATYIAISGTTNIILIAGGAGGGYALSPNTDTASGGPGGGFWFGSTDAGPTTATNASIGQGAWASNEYGLAATAGTNINVSITNLMHNGGYLRGGHASTNGCTAGTTGFLGGGGGGWYGGAGATRTNATIGMTVNVGAGGGGGLGYADTNYVTFAQIIRGGRGSNGQPPAQDHPTYTAGRAVGSGNGGGGQDGCAGAMW